jgi:hypothetical protein
VLLLLCALLLAACAPVQAPPPGATTGATTPATSGATANLVELAGLDRAQSIEIGVFDTTAAVPYPAAATVADAAEVARFVALLDQPLPLGPAAACLDAYRLRFTLDDGSVREIGFACQTTPTVLRAEFSGLQGRSLAAPAELAALVAAQLQAR